MSSAHFVDVDKLPPDDREAIKHLATKNNAFIHAVHGVIGATEDEQVTSGKVLSAIRAAWKWLEGHRFNFAGASFVAFLIIQILKSIGVDTTELAPLIYGVVKHLIGGLV